MKQDIQTLLKYGNRKPSLTYWCKKCNIPLIQEKCENCGKEGIIISKSPLRPVFKEELDIIRKQTKSKSEWLKLPDLSFWSSKRNYFYNGEKIFTTAGLTNGKPLSINFHIKEPQFKRSLRKETIIKRLKKANQSSLNKLEYQAIEFIERAVKTFPGRLPVVSFSGGKDSCVVSHLVRLALGTKVIHIFGDTTIEYPDTYKFINKFKRDNPTVPFLIAKPTKDFFELAEELGPPSRILRWCCTTHKTGPIGQMKTSLNGNGILAFIGSRRVESIKRSKHKVITIENKIAKEFAIYPILTWSDTELWMYALTRNIDFCDVYKFGFMRLGCMYCPFNSGQSEYLMRLKYKEYTNKWDIFLESFARKMNYKSIEKFKEYGWKARAGARGLEKDPTKIIKNECLKDDNAYNYELSIWKESFFEYLKPFGLLSKIYDDGTVANYNVVNAKTNESMFFVKISRPRRYLRIVLFDKKNKKLLLTRIENQIKRFQSCVLCGQCQNVCKVGAFSPMQNGEYKIDERICVNCLECIKKPCIVQKSLKKIIGD